MKMTRNEISIEHKDGNMVLNHPSGHVDTYTVTNVNNWIEQTQKRITELTTEISDYTIIKQDMLVSEL